MDVAVAAAAAVVCLPLAAAIYVCIRLSGSRQVLFRQERVGRHGAIFHILKFRTMRVDSEPDSVPRLAQTGDERLTRVGRILRSYHLDELPQLWNVLRGDMSLVGYRPERRYFIDMIMAVRPDYAELYSMRPGLTSMATLYNGYTDTMEKMTRRLDMDLDYLRHHTLATDIRILLLTLVRVARHRS